MSPGSWGHPDIGELTRGETTESRVTVPFDDGAGRGREAPMSFRELSIIEIREVLRRWLAGQAVRAVARETGVDRKTVDRYVTAARELGAAVGAEPTDEVVAAVGERVQGRPLPPASDQWREVERFRPRIGHWLKSETPLRLVRIHELLAREGLQVSYAAARRADIAGLDSDLVLERWDKTAKVHFDKRVFQELTSLRFIEATRNVVILGQVGVGKTFVASALGHLACKSGFNVRFVRADALLARLK